VKAEKGTVREKLEWVKFEGIFSQLLDMVLAWHQLCIHILVVSMEEMGCVLNRNDCHVEYSLLRETWRGYKFNFFLLSDMKIMPGGAFIQAEQAVCRALLQLKEHTDDAKEVCCVSVFYFCKTYKFHETL
jgi:hypothetical protein